MNGWGQGCPGRRNNVRKQHKIPNVFEREGGCIHRAGKIKQFNYRSFESESGSVYEMLH